MQRVTDQVDAIYLERVPPRPLQTAVMLNLINDHIFDRPSTTFLDPLLLASVVILIGLVAIHASPLLRLVPIAVIVARLVIDAQRVWRRVSEDLALLRN